LPALHLGQLQAIYDAAPVGLCFLDASLRYMSINKRLAKMNGASVAFHIGRHVQDLHPLLFKNVESYIRRALEGESLSGIEVTAPNLEPDSRPRTLLLSYEPVWDEADEVVGVVVAVVDITSRKVAEEALKDSQDHHRHSVELNPQIPWIMDVEGGSVEISPRWGQITGVTAEEALNRGWLKAVHPDDIERTLSVMRTALKTGDPIDMEYRLKYAGGEWHWMRSRGSPLRDASGSIVRWYGSVEDIDDRKKMEQALIESEAMLKAVFAAAPVGIVIAEAANGRIVMSNPQAETIFKRPRHSSDTIADYRKSGAYDTAGRLLEASDYPLAKAIETGKPTGPLELLYRRVDGSSAWIRASAAPLRNPHGEIIGGVVALLDIDDLKREKQVLVDRISELERQLGEIRDSSDSASLRSQ
jgi:PAS domain S-box-containing protein